MIATPRGRPVPKSSAPYTVASQRKGHGCNLLVSKRAVYTGTLIEQCESTYNCDLKFYTLTGEAGCQTTNGMSCDYGGALLFREANAFQRANYEV